MLWEPSFPVMENLTLSIVQTVFYTRCGFPYRRFTRRYNFYLWLGNEKKNRVSRFFLKFIWRKNL